MSDEPPRPVDEEELQAALADIPPVSSVLQRILVVLSDPRSDLDDITRLVRAETMLAAQVLRLANSAAFALQSKVSSVEEAIQHLGFAEVHRLVCALGSRQFFLSSLTHVGFDAATLWEHTLAVAVSAETVAHLGQTDRNLAYLAGILHPVGIVACNRLAQMRHLPVRPAEQSLQEWENSHFGTDNAGMAARVLRLWNFPATIAAVVAGRYLPGAAGDQMAAASVLHVASCLAEKLGAALPGEKGLFLPAGDRISAAGIQWDEFSDVEIEAAQNLQRTRALLNLA